MAEGINTRFSIIVPIYNVESYLSDCINSIINQSIGFSDSVQLILVNDGSTDDSESICLDYYEKYPNNILYIYKHNGGVSSARNAGLNRAVGDIIGFVDPDDMIAPDVLRQVSAFFKSNGKFIDMVGIPLEYFERREGLHPKYKYMPEGGSIIDVIQDPYNFIFSVTSIYYKRDIFTNRRFNEELSIGEDFEFNLSLLQEKPLFGYVSTDNVLYHYRVRNAGGSCIDNTKGNPDALYTILNILETHFPRGKELLEYEKEIIAYQCIAWVPQISEEEFKDSRQYADCVDRFRSMLERLDLDFIMRRSKALGTFAKRLAVLKLIDVDFGDLMRSNLVSMQNSIIRILSVRLRDEYLDIHLTHSAWGYDDFIVQAFFGGETVNPYSYTVLNGGPFDKNYGNIHLDDTRVSQFRFPLRKGKILFAFYDRAKDCYYRPRSVRPPRRTCFCLNDRRVGISNGEFRVSFSTRAFFVVPLDSVKSKSDVFYRHVGKTNPDIDISLRSVSEATKRFLLFNDRPMKAGDNGEALFRYVMDNEESLRERSFYVVSKDSADFHRLNAEYPNHIVDHGSELHKELFINSAVVYSSHNTKSFYSPFTDIEYDYFHDLLKYEFVWLQHGIVMNDVCKAANKYNAGDDYIVCSAPAEREQFLQDRYFYSDNEILLTGLARFDRLESDPKNVITIAPTWRSWLSGPVLPTGYHDPLPSFKYSNYFETYASLLKNEELVSLLDENDYRLKLLLHPGFLCHKELFDEVAISGRIEVLSAEDVSYHDIYRDSKLFITDYSSSAFDFAYLGKPIIYYQFDREEFFSKHYEHGWFDYCRDGLGDVVTTEEQLIKKIEFYFQNGFSMEEKYISKSDSFFAFRDKNNCKRILDATLYNPSFSMTP